MYSVFIVDDEEFVVKSLVRGTNWAEHGFEVIASSNDGMDAYEDILRLKPDLVFTDIRMPGMTGLELIKNVKEKLSSVNFVIISGYAEFAYAQKAINYGAIGYCLKPFDNDEISNVLKKVKTLLDNAGKNEVGDMIGLIEDDGNESRTELLNCFKDHGIDPYKGIIVAASIGEKQAMSFEPLRSIRIMVGKEKAVYFIQKDPEVPFAGRLTENMMSDLRGIGIQDEIFSPENLKMVIDDTVALAYQYFITGDKGPFLKSSDDFKNIERTIINFENSMIRMDIEGIKKALDSFVMSSKAGSMNIKHAVNIFNAYVYFAGRVLEEEGYEEYIYSIDDLCKQFDNIFLMLEYINTSIIKIINRNQIGLKEVKNEYFRRIIDYIDQNFYHDITMQSLLQKYAINPNYLCQLFRRKLGLTFTDYITRLRINYSKELLKETKLTLDEIASKSGYTDYFYFIRVFKKITGFSPGQFRNEECWKQ
jgi:two-component system response regulator YesN